MNIPIFYYRFFYGISQSFSFLASSAGDVTTAPQPEVTNLPEVIRPQQVIDLHNCEGTSVGDEVHVDEIHGPVNFDRRVANTHNTTIHNHYSGTVADNVSHTTIHNHYYPSPVTTKVEEPQEKRTDGGRLEREVNRFINKDSTVGERVEKEVKRFLRKL